MTCRRRGGGRSTEAAATQPAVAFRCGKKKKKTHRQKDAFFSPKNVKIAQRARAIMTPPMPSMERPPPAGALLAGYEDDEDDDEEEVRGLSRRQSS